jgi:outer membrane biosynthesis protein TonB
MTRDAQIPLFLWIATAVVVHALWGGGADRAAQVIEEKIEIREFAASVRRFVRGENKPIEVALLDDTSEPKPPEPTATPEPNKPEPEQPDKKSADKDEAKPEKPKTPPEPKKEPEEKKKPEEKKAEEKKPEEEKKPAEAMPEPAPAPQQEKRVAVKQHAQPNQEDNPNAHFIADEANHVDEESRARITSTDQDDPKPTPGGAAQSSKDPNDPGDSDETKILQSDERKGAPDKAPAEHAASPSPKVAEQPAHSAPSTAAAQARAEGAQAGAQKSTSTSKLPAEAGQEAKPALHAADEVPETIDSQHGGWEVAREKAGSIEQPGRQARKRRELPPMRVPGLGGLLGLGATGTTPGGMNLNLTPQVAVAAIGEDTLKHERIADGERRRSQHAGHWRPSGIERWRSAIENYVPSVRPGNQTALNTAAVPFASYLNQIHNRIHPIFADTFLASLDQLPASDPMNRGEIYTSLEIVVDHEDGKITRMGVTRTSGVTAFDVAALDSVSRAQPFGTPPREIVSPDGNVYLHWEFHRGVEACGTANAHPYMLKVQPKTAPPPAEPATPPENKEEERHGQASPPSRGKTGARPPLAFAKTLGDKTAE